jgi:hypothetical protein
MPLYDKALIGGADHIMAHASAGQIGHPCITKAFTDDIDAINDWSRLFYNVINGRIGYVKGDLFHIWHGDLEKRQYLKRIQDFTHKTKDIVEKDENGLYITKKEDDQYVREYFKHREVDSSSDFLKSMALGYATDSTIIGAALGGDILGAAIGDSLNTTDDFSGGDYIKEENFS